MIALAFLAGVARGDAADPREYDCRQLGEGDPCPTGVCTKATCTSGHPGAFVERECLMCKPGEPRTGAKHTPLYIGLGIGALALAGGIWFARRRGKRAA